MILIASLYITFTYKNFRTFLKLVAFAHISAIIVGGTTLAIYYYTSTMFFNTLSYISIRFLLASTLISFIIIKLAFFYIQRTLLSKQSFCEIKIFRGDTVAKLTVLVDTGNTLTEPLSHFPVIVAELKSIKKLINDEKAESISSKIRMIPFKSVGTSNGLLVGFRPDKVEINTRDTNILVEEVVIGICNFTLSKNGNYQGLLNPALIS